MNMQTEGMQFFNPFLTSGLVHPNYLDDSISRFRGYLLLYFALEFQ